MKIRCSQCGQEIERQDILAVCIERKLTRMQMAILLALANANGEFLTSLQIADRVYEDRIDGGPESADSNTRVQVFRAKKKLVGTGICIEGVSHQGYRLLIGEARS